MTPSELQRTIRDQTGDIGAAFYFHPDTLARGKELGLDGFRWYFLGRGGVLGDVEPSVVHSAFGYFHPDLVTKMWNSARAKLAPRDAAREYLACAHAFGRAKFGGVEGLSAYSGAAAKVVAAVDDSAMALFAGLRAEPVPDDPEALAMHHAILLRELRGGARLVAITSIGMTPLVAHTIREPDMVTSFGHADAAEVTDAAREADERAEEITDLILAPAFGVLSDAEAAVLVETTAALHAALTG